MNRLLRCTLLLLGVALFATPAQAQVYHSTFFAPVVAPTMVAPTVIAPTTVFYRPNRVTTYFAPVPVVPVTSFMAPVAAPIQVTNFYAPTATPVTTFFAPTVPVVVPTVAPVFVGRPAVVRSTVYFPGQPIRNVFRAIGP
jgi:hypothetical protein